MGWVQMLQSAQVTAEQLAVGRREAPDAVVRIGNDVTDVSRLLRLRERWPEWGDAVSAAVVIRLRALDDLMVGDRLAGVDLLDGALLAAAAEAPIEIVDGSAWAFDWPRFIAIAHDANRAEMQGLGLAPMDEVGGGPAGGRKRRRGRARLMRDYSKIASTFWTGVTGRALRGDAPAQVVAMYLLTNPHSTMIGVYVCPPMYIAHETGLTIAQAEQAMVRLEDLGFCLVDRDHDLIWVREMARFQIGDTLSPGDRRVKNVASHFAKIPHGAIRDGFASRYGAAFHIPSDGASKGHPRGHHMHHGMGHQTPKNAPSEPCKQPEMPLRSQEQEKEQKSPVLTDGTAVPEPEPVGLRPFQSVFEQPPPLRLVAHDTDAEAMPPAPTLPADPSVAERDLFARGREVLGASAGGQIAKLLKAKGANVALARSALETASTKHNPREYVARVIRGDDTGLPAGQLYDRSI